MATLRLPDWGPVKPIPAKPPEPANSPAAWALFHEIMSTHEGRNALISASYELPFATVRDAVNALEPVVGVGGAHRGRPQFGAAGVSNGLDADRTDRPSVHLQMAASVAGPRPATNRKKTIAEEAADGNVSNIHPDWGYFAPGPIPKADVDWRVNPFINTVGSAGNLVLNPIVGALSAIEPYTPALDNLAMTLPGMGPPGTVPAAVVRTFSQLARFAAKVRDSVRIVRPLEEVLPPASGARVPSGLRVIEGTAVQYPAGPIVRQIPSVPPAVDPSSAVNAARLNRQLTIEEASSIFEPSGKLRPETVLEASAMRKLGPGKLKNRNIPVDFGKYASKTQRSPSGDFEVHFYKKPDTGEVFYDFDYKSEFNDKGTGNE